MSSTNTLTGVATTAAATLPDWFREFLTFYEAGVAHGFILSGDVWGATMQGMSQRRFLQEALTQAGRRVIAIYSRASGITFPLASMRQRAEQLLAADAPAALASSDPFSAALDQAGLGVRESGDPFGSARSPREALTLLERLLRAPQGSGEVTVILDYADVLVPDQQKAIMSPDDRLLLVTLLWWGQDEAMAACGNPIFLVSRNAGDLHEDLRSSGSGYKLIEIPLPTLEERRAYLAWYLQLRESEGKAIALNDGLNEQALAILTAGLTLRHLEDLLLLGARGGVDRGLVKARKDAIIRSEFSDIAAMVDPLPGGFSSVGGMPQLISWMQEDLIRPIREGRVQDAPKGVLLVGPPGTGKTHMVRAMSAEIGFNCVALKAENVLGSLVGQSERQLARFFAFVRALAPVLVFMDELDQSDLSRRGTGSGNPVASNLFSQMLQFVGDESLRGRVLVVFASNRPDLIDQALLRSGRMDAIVPVLLPDPTQRRDILRVQAQQQGASITEEALDWLTGQTEKYSASDLAALVTKARRLAARGGGQQVTLADVQLAWRYLRPNTPGIADRYTLLAVAACNDGELLPPAYAQLLLDRPALEARLMATGEGPSRLARGGRTL